MCETSPPNCPTSSQLRCLRSEQIKNAMALGTGAGELRSLRELVHQVLLTRPGPPSSSGSYPTPTSPSSIHGTPWSTRKRDLMKRAKDLGEWVGRAARIMGLIKAIFWLLGILTPWLLLMLAAIWKLVGPYVSRLALSW